MSGKASRRKGDRIEREVVELHRAIGVEAVRVPLSGAAGGQFSGDLRIGPGLVAEVKCRENGQGFVQLEKWLGERDLLFLVRDRSRPLVVMPWRVYAGHFVQSLGSEAPTKPERDEPLGNGDGDEPREQPKRESGGRRAKSRIIVKVELVESPKMQARAKVAFALPGHSGLLWVNGWRIVEGKGGKMFVRPPATQGSKRYINIAFVEKGSLRDEIEARILDAYYEL